MHSLIADRASFLWYSASVSAQGAHLQYFIAIFAILIIAKQYTPLSWKFVKVNKSKYNGAQ